MANASPVVFRHVRFFDGVQSRLSDPSDVLVREGVIESIAAEPMEVPGATVIEAGNRVLMPGLIDAHVHALVSRTFDVLQNSTDAYIILAGKQALEQMLMRGFTTARDASGADGGLVQAIDEGLVAGPRLYPSGLGLSQSSGHGDFFPLGLECRCEQVRNVRGLFAVVDGIDAVLRATRDNLKKGATQIKIMAGGGVASRFDPLHTVQFTPEEIRAAVACAENWGTYVMAHAYTSGAVRQCVENGVRSIEHGHLIDDETAAIVADHGAVVSTQIACFKLGEMFGPQIGFDAAQMCKNSEVLAGLGRFFDLLRSHGIRIGFGTDLLGPGQQMQSMEFTLRKEFFSPVEILRQATSENADIMAMCGALNPYGRLGVIEAGAVADLLLVRGDPLEDVTVLAAPDTNLDVIMKDGVLHKHVGDEERGPEEVSPGGQMSTAP